MGDSEKNMEGALNNLQEEISLLKKRVGNLENRLAEGSDRVSDTRYDTETATRSDHSRTWSEGSMANIMSRGAAVSIVLLIALVLRVLTDSGVVAPGTGTLLGVGYTFLLEGAGFWMYRKESSYASIFSIAGILLLIAVIVESHTVLHTIPTDLAYALMVLAAGGMTVMGLIHRAALPVCVGIITVLVAGVPLDFPEPDFVALSIFLASVNVMAFTVQRLKRCRWVRSTAFAFTAAILLLWAVKLTAALKSGPSSTADSAWFFSLAVFFFIFYTVASVLTVRRNTSGDRDVFINLLPTTAGILCYLTSLMVVQALGTGQRALGVIGTGIATFLLCIATLRAMQPVKPPGGINTFAFPAAFLLALSFRDVSGESVVALAILSWAALSLAWLSIKWTSEGVRVTSYFLQAMVLGASTLLLWRNPSGDQPAAVILSMIFTGAVAFFHYVFVRRTPPTGQTAYFSHFDKKDMSGIIPLFVAAGTVFLALRSVFYIMLNGGGQTFQAAETSMISLVALILFAVAWVGKNSEYKWIAVFITVLGGGKVFLYDLFKVKGVPVLLSFLAFALAASMGSLIMKRWPQQDAS